MTELPEHLGGHKNRTHLDEGSLSHMQRMMNVKSMIDIGCGPGGMVKLANEMGIKAQGIDGDWSVDRTGVNKDWITIHDYEKGPSQLGDKKFDLAWSCEFVEHVYEKYIPNFMPDFQRANFVIMTFAPVGKAGHHHVNCNTQEYWIDVFNQYGFGYDPNMTRHIREATTMNIKGKAAPRKAFVKNNGLCFVKK